MCTSSFIILLQRSHTVDLVDGGKVAFLKDVVNVLREVLQFLRHLQYIEDSSVVIQGHREGHSSWFWLVKSLLMR